MIKISIDAMGGDFAPRITCLAALEAVKKCDDIELTLFGNQKEMEKYISENDRIKMVHTELVVSMEEKEAIQKMRRDKETSMALGLHAVKDKQADAFITAGSTGAYIAGAHLIVKRIKGIKRTALAPFIPKKNGKFLFLDVGANLESKAEYLLQYANCATIYLQEIFNIENPKVALINNGIEEGKGRELEKETYQLLKDNPRINFIGNVEGQNILATEADIVVTDGFTGNMILKTAEGALKTFSNILKEKITENLSGKIGYLFMRKNLKSVKEALGASDVGGAILLGVQAPCIKAHGSSNEHEYCNAILLARETVKNKMIEKIQKRILDDGQK